jgi:hypothetical protein
VAAKKPTAYEEIPFELKGADRGFKVIVTFYAREPGSGGAPYRQTGRVALRFST